LVSWFSNVYKNGNLSWGRFFSGFFQPKPRISFFKVLVLKQFIKVAYLIWNILFLLFITKNITFNFRWCDEIKNMNSNLITFTNKLNCYTITNLGFSFKNLKVTRDIRFDPHLFLTFCLSAIRSKKGVVWQKKIKVMPKH